MLHKLKANLLTAISILGGVSVACDIVNVSLQDFIPYLTSPQLKLVGFLIILMGLVVNIYIMQYVRLKRQKEIKLTINHNSITIRKANLFEMKGWKVVAFNEYYDTKVDDKIIAKNSICGQFIMNYSDQEKLKKDIKRTETSNLVIIEENGRRKYPLGYIKSYVEPKDNNGGGFFLLAFTHFNDQKEAYLNNQDHINCLMTMWQEINRCYAIKPISLPLLGNGITRGISSTKESKTLYYLYAILATLKLSGITFKNTITVCVYDQAEWQEIKKIDKRRFENV